MSSIAERKVRDLQGSIRSFLEDLFGRTLDPDEQVTFVAAPAHAESALDRQAAWQYLEELLAKMRANIVKAGEAELEAAVEEAMDYVRYGREPSRRR